MFRLAKASKRGEASASLPRRLWLWLRLRESFRILLDELFDIALQADQHFLLYGYVEVDLDRLVGRRDRDAAGQRHINAAPQAA